MDELVRSLMSSEVVLSFGLDFHYTKQIQDICRLKTILDVNCSLEDFEKTLLTILKILVRQIMRKHLFIAMGNLISI